MSKRTLVLLVGLVALVVFVAGCGGGGGGDSSTSGETLTKSEFIKQGDAICKEGDAGLEDEANEFADENNIDTNKPTEAQQEEVISQVVGPALRQQGEEISELGVPKGDESKVEAILDAIESAAGELEDNPKALLEGSNPIEEASKLAKEYGFKECGNEG